MESFLKDEEKGEDRPELILPPAGVAGHLVDYLFEVGPTEAGEVLTFREIEAWSRMTGYTLASWEAVFLRRLSGAYASELQAAEDPARPPPYMSATVEAVDHQAVSKARLEMFMRLAAQHEGQEAET